MSYHYIQQLKEENEALKKACRDYSSTILSLNNKLREQDRLVTHLRNVIDQKNHRILKCIEITEDILS